MMPYNSLLLKLFMWPLQILKVQHVTRNAEHATSNYLIIHSHKLHHLINQFKRS